MLSPSSDVATTVSSPITSQFTSPSQLTSTPSPLLWVTLTELDTELDPSSSSSSPLWVTLTELVPSLLLWVTLWVTLAELPASAVTNVVITAIVVSASSMKAAAVIVATFFVTDDDLIYYVTLYYKGNIIYMCSTTLRGLLNSKFCS